MAMSRHVISPLPVGQSLRPGDVYGYTPSATNDSLVLISISA